MKKYILLTLLTTLTSLSSFAQDAVYECFDSPATCDSSVIYFGYWSRKPLFSMKDDIGNRSRYFLKFSAKNLYYPAHVGKNDGNPLNIMWLGTDSLLKVSPFPTIPTNNNQLTNGSSYITTSGARSAISLTTIGTGASTYNSSIGVLNIPTPTSGIIDYTNTGSISGGSGNVVFYLTSDKTSTGTALYSTITYVNPIVNDAIINYTYGWSYNSTTKALTVNVKAATGLYVALLNLTLLGTPANVANGTSVNILVKGQ